MTILDIIIEGKDNASDELKGVDSALGNLGSKAGGIAAAGLGIATGAVLAVGAAAVGTAVAAVNLSSDIQNATNNIAAQMGISQDSAAGFEGVMKGIFANNFGENFDDIGAAIVTVSQSLGDMPDEALQGITEDAFAMRDAFGMEVTESVTGAKSLMEAFGLSGEQAMDFIASGMQNGLNASGDFVESIGEYGNLFSEAGFSAEEMYNIMESGAQAGILGTDKIADAVKEMGIILNEGGEDTKAAFDTIGLSFDDIAASVADGSADWGDYFNDIVGGLNDIEDPMARSQAQVAIFGTMAEDLGVSFTEGLSSAGMALDGMSGATEALNAQYDNWPSMWEGIKRNALLALEPLGDVLLDIGNRVMPIINDAFTWLQDNVAPIIEGIADLIGVFFDNLESGMNPLTAFTDMMLNWTEFGEENARLILDIKDAINGLIGKIKDIAEPIIAFVKENIKLKDILIIVGGVITGAIISALASLIAAIAPVIAIIAGAVLIVATLRKAWETDFGGIRDFTAGVWGAIKQAFDAFKTLFQGDLQGFITKIKDAWETGFNALAEFVGNLWGEVKPHLLAFWESFKAWFTGIKWGEVGQTILSAIGAYIQLHANIAKWILSAAQKLATALIEWFGTVNWAEIGQTILSAIGAGIDALKPYIITIGENIVGYIKAGLEKFGALVKTTIDGWVQVFKDWAEDALTWENFGYLLAKAIIAGMDFIKELPAKLKEFWTSLTGWFEDKKTAFSGQGEVVSTSIAEGLAELWTNAKVKFEEMWTSVTAWFAEDKDWAQMGRDIITGLISGITEKLESAVTAITNIADAIKTGWNNAMESTSPSKVFRLFGSWLPAGLALGIEDGAHKAIDAITELGESMTAEMVSMVASIIAVIGPMMSALRMLASFNIDSAALFAKLDDFGQLIYYLGRVFASAGWQLVYTNRQEAVNMAKAVGPIAKSVVEAIGAFSLLAEAQFPPNLVHQIDLLIGHIQLLIVKFGELSDGMTDRLSQEIINLANAAIAVSELIKPAIDGMTTLAETDFGEIVQGMHLADQIDTFMRIIRTLVLRFLEAALLLNTEMSEQVSAFASAAGAVVGLIEEAIEGVKKLSEVSFGDIVQGMHLADQIQIFRNIIRTIMREFADAAAEMDSELSNAISDFANAAGAIFELIENAIVSVTLLSETNFGDIVQGMHLAEQIVIFRNIVRTLIDRFAEVAADMTGELSEQVRNFADAINSIIGFIAPAIEALAALSEYTQQANLEVKIREFTADLMLVITALVNGFSSILPDIEIAMEDAAAIASAINSIIAVIIPGLEAMTGIAEWVRDKEVRLKVDIFIEDLIGIVSQLINGFKLAFRAFSDMSIMVSFVQSIAEFLDLTNQIVASIAGLVDNIEAAIENLKRLATMDVPGGISDIMAGAIQKLKDAIPAAATAGYDFGMAWVDGVREAIGSLSFDTRGGAGGGGSVSLAGAAAGVAGSGGLTTNINLGGLTFNTTVNNQMDEDELHFRIIETIRGLVT